MPANPYSPKKNLNCPKCGKKTTLYSCQGGNWTWLCADCLPVEGKYKCDNCDIYSNRLYKTNLVSGKKIFLCGSCMSAKEYTCCAACGVYTDAGTKDHFLCPDCKDKKKHRCVSCGNPFWDNVLREYNGALYCPTCFANSVSSTIQLRYHLYRPKLRFFDASGNFQGRVGRYSSAEKSDLLYMGAELEVDDGITHQCALPKKIRNAALGFFFFKHDGSLSRSGIECVSHPATLEFHKKHKVWERLTKALRLYDYRSFDAANSCGFHVHVNKSFFPVSSENCLQRFVFNNALACSRVAQRVSESYSGFQSNGRYSAINLTNKNTVEFRFFQGTMNTSTLMRYLEFVDASCRYTAQCANRKTNMFWVDFCQFVDKCYLELAQYMKDRKAWMIVVSSPQDRESDIALYKHEGGWYKKPEEVN